MINFLRRLIGLQPKKKASMKSNKPSAVALRMQDDIARNRRRTDNLDPLDPLNPLNPLNPLSVLQLEAIRQTEEHERVREAIRNMHPTQRVIDVIGMDGTRRHIHAGYDYETPREDPRSNGLHDRHMGSHTHQPTPVHDYHHNHSPTVHHSPSSHDSGSSYDSGSYDSGGGGGSSCD